MGRLKRTDGPNGIELPCRSLVGRSPAVFVRLRESCASREHAVLEWRDSSWRLRDLGSRNGTTINRRPCGAAWHELERGDELCFGGQEESWVLTSSDGPPPAAIGPAGKLVLGRGALLLLPSADAPHASVHHQGGSWVLDNGDTLATISDGSVVVDAQRFDLLLPGVPTLASTGLAGFFNYPTVYESELTFEVDRSEERVEMTARQGEQLVRLPARTSSYLLLVLARARVRDRAERSLPETEAGWVDSRNLAEHLRISPERLNVDVFRARKLFSDHGFVDAANVVERRTEHRSLRIGFQHIVLRRLVEDPLAPTRGD